LYEFGRCFDGIAGEFGSLGCIAGLIEGYCEFTVLLPLVANEWRAGIERGEGASDISSSSSSESSSIAELLVGVARKGAGC